MLRSLLAVLCVSFSFLAFAGNGGNSSPGAYTTLWQWCTGALQSCQHGAGQGRDVSSFPEGCEGIDLLSSTDGHTNPDISSRYRKGERTPDGLAEELLSLTLESKHPPLSQAQPVLKKAGKAGSQQHNQTRLPASTRSSRNPGYGIITAFGGKDGGSGKGTSGGGSSSGQGAQGGTGRTGSSGAGDEPSAPEGGHSPGGEGDKGAGQNYYGSQQVGNECEGSQYLLKVGENSFAMEKRVVNSNKLDAATVTRQSDGAVIRLRDIEHGSTAPEPSLLAGNGDPLDYFLRYGVVESLIEYHRSSYSNSHSSPHSSSDGNPGHQSSSFALPKEELLATSPAIIAALSGRRHIVRMLQQAGSPTPLYSAVSRKLIESAKYLISLRYPLDEPLPDGEVLLHLAVANQDVPLTRLLLERSANPNIRRFSDGFSPFHLAVRNMSVNLVRLMAPYADKNLKTVSEQTLWQLLPPCDEQNKDEHEALIELVEVQNPDAPENFGHFIDHIKAGKKAEAMNYTKLGVDFNVYWENLTPLHIAVQEGNPEMVKALLDRVWENTGWLNKHQKAEGAEGKSSTEDHSPGAEGQPCGLLAAGRQVKSASRLFLILNGLTKDTLETPLHLAVKGAINPEADSSPRGDGKGVSTVKRREAFITIIKYLLEYGVKADAPRESDGVSPLYMAVKAGDNKVVSSLLRADLPDQPGANIADVNWVHRDNGATVLHVAVESDRTDIARMLLRAGAYASVAMERNGRKEYPLDIAIQNRNPEMISMVSRQSWFLFDLCKSGQIEPMSHYLEAGVSATLGRQGERTLLHSAAQWGQTDMINLLVRHGADVNAVNKNRETALHFAAESGHLPAVEALTHARAELLANRSGKTPVDLALNKHHGQLANCLLDYYFPSGFEQTWDYPHPLIEAIKRGKPEDVKFIKEMKQEGCLKASEQLDRDGNTPLHLAALHRSVSTIPCLIGPGLHKRQNTRWETPLHTAIITNDEATIIAFQPLMNPTLFWAIRNGHLYLAQMILDSGVEFPVIEEGTGNHPLHVAAMAGELKSVRLLLNSRAEFRHTDVKNAAGNTPLHEALNQFIFPDVFIISEEYFKVIQCLLDAEGGRAFFNAARENDTGLMKGFLKARVNIDCIDQSGNSAFHHAAARGHMDMIRLLMDRGALQNEKNRNGKTPCQLARQHGHNEIVRLLDNGFCTLL